jgi:hypothetical protein
VHVETTAPENEMTPTINQRYGGLRREGKSGMSNAPIPSSCVIPIDNAGHAKLIGTRLQ